MSKCEITIGVKNVKIDPNYTFSIISHEVSEIILIAINCRYYNNGASENYLFNLTHDMFSNFIQIQADVLRQFIA
jgi:hypothetical protein